MRGPAEKQQRNPRKREKETERVVITAIACPAVTFEAQLPGIQLSGRFERTMSAIRNDIRHRLQTPGWGTAPVLFEGKV